MERCRLKYPVGIQSFSEIRNENYLYVDKTELIFNLVQDNKYVFLSRPRRFGKSLLASTIHAYMRGQKELFNGLAISRLEKDWTEYPVLRLDLSMESYENTHKLVALLSDILSDWEERYNLPASQSSVARRFEKTIAGIYHSTGRRVVILIDEYDKPILENLHQTHTADEIRTLLRGFYSVIKGSDKYVKFVLVTGVSKFAHLSIFSGFNNLRDISLLPDYEAICGITEAELHAYFKESVAEFARSNEMTEEDVWQQFKRQYDGYHFSRRMLDIYNPFSVLNAFNDRDIRDYWFKTGTPRYLVTLARRNHYPLFMLDRPVRSQSKLEEVTESTDDYVSLLFQAGYLTLSGWDSETKMYTLDFPNEEVKYGFWNSFAESYFPASGYSTGFDVFAMLRMIKAGEAERFMVCLQSLISSANSENEPDKEIHFQNIMAVIFYMLGLSVRTEIHSAKGRCDLVMKTDSYIYIFEFKVNGSSAEAMHQIKEQGYALPYMADSRQKILIAANFSTASRTLSDWIIEPDM